jgi:GT2 family glycosyltransferase
MRHGTPASALKGSECEIFSPCAAAALYRRSALLEVGGFDEDFFCYVEDVDLGFRLRLAGYRCLYVPLSVAHHIGSGTTGGKNSDFSVYHGHRNLVWAFVKNMPGVLTVSGARIGGIGGLTAYRQPLLQFLGHQATDPTAAA